MIAIALTSRGIRAAAVRAAKRVHPLAQITTLGDLPTLLACAHESRCLLLHDFEPDAVASLELLRRARTAGTSIGVLAWITPPATPVLDLLLTLGGDPLLCGIVIAGEEGPDRLSERIRTALARSGRRELLEVVMAGWSLDPVLGRVARCELTGDRPHTTLAGLLREAGVGRKRFVNAASQRGISPPLRFLQGLRVMEAVELLQEGCTARRTAERLGYGSPDTLRRHFRMLAGITPTTARVRRLEEMAASVGTGAGLL